uniref:N-acetyltransferase domain-containing protein n=1 Tax=Leersia perrieri TaxID=77586 RepID=A0A0D9W025_9ORYZ
METRQEPQAVAPTASGGVEVTLRRFELSDLDAMMAWASDPEVAAFCRWEPYDSTDHLLAYLRDTVLPHPWIRAICLAAAAAGDDDRPVGAVSVTPTADACRGELGYVVARAHWGKGVATAAARRAVAAVFGEVEGLERVEALVDVRNAASQRVLEKAGFRREDVLRKYRVIKGDVKDMVIYSFVSTDSLTTAGREEEEAHPMEVTLRRFELSDLDAMMAWASDPEVAAFCRWEPYESTDHLLAYLRDTVLPHPWFRAICLAAAGDERPVGQVSVWPYADEGGQELGYVLARAHWGKGVATAAVRRVVATVFGEGVATAAARRAVAAVFGEVEGLERVEALVDVKNAASQRVLEKAGFRREGVLRRHYWHKGRVRDLVMFSFISSNPLPNTAGSKAAKSETAKG